MVLKLCHDKNVSTADWFDWGLREPPPGWNGRPWRAGQRRDRYGHAHAGSESGRSTSTAHRARGGRRLDAVAVTALTASQWESKPRLLIRNQALYR
jgi:hypothetical protein